MAFSLANGSEAARSGLLLAHGAGAGISSPFLETMALNLADRDIAVTRFEFNYMAARRTAASKRPPPRAEMLTWEYLEAVRAFAAKRPKNQAFLIGGKSLGGRVASLVADELHAAGEISGLVCLGYPFHPPGKPAQLRTMHLVALECPALIVQGERDPFGTRAEVEALDLSKHITFAWVGDGDHDFGPRVRSGFTRSGNIAAAADAVAVFARRLSVPR